MRRPPISTRTDSLFPCSTRFRALGGIARNNMIVGIEVEAGDIADDRQLIDVDLTGADKEIGREGVDEVANRRIRESEVAEADLLPLDTGDVDATSRHRLSVAQQRPAPFLARLPMTRRRRAARCADR